MWLALFLGLTAAVKHTITVSHDCIVVNETSGECTSWQSGGSLEAETSCFPGGSVVLSDHGVVRMDKLKVGDLILGHDASTGLDVFTPVRSWLHRFATIEYNYIKLHTKRGELEVAKYHNIAVVAKDGSIDYTYADAVDVGSSLWAREGPEAVINKTASPNVGLYAPLTLLSNFYVGTNSSNMYLAHAFAHVRFPESIAPVLHGVMSACELFDGTLHDLDNHAEYVHPVARRLQSFFPFLLDGPPQKINLGARATSSNNNKKRFLKVTLGSLMSPNPMIFCSKANCLGALAV